ncbi:MAG: hypothetical protein P1U36_05355 [Legionellaceae bacterium]|nr:hypothetical protein [Legionellaceae bacterium]
MKYINGVPGDAESVETDSTRSLSDSDGESVTDSVDENLEKATVASSVGFFKAKPTKLRLQRSDAYEREDVTERLAAIHQEKEVNLKYIDTNRKELYAHQEKNKELLKTIIQVVDLINTKKEENKALHTAETAQRIIIGPMHENIENVSFLEPVWSAIYHIFGWKTAHETLCERRNEISSKMKAMRDTIKVNITEISEAEQKQSNYAKRSSVQEGLIIVTEKYIIEYEDKNAQLEKEEADLIKKLPLFKDKQNEFDRAIKVMILSCKQLTEPSMLSKMQRKKALPNVQAVAQALSDFLKTPTESTQKELATSINHNPAYTEEPKLQKLLEEASGYYSEIGEMLDRDEARPNM